MKQTFHLVHPVARQRAAQALQNAPEGHVMTLAEPTRNLEQNAAQWPILQSFAEQLQWPVNGRMIFMDADDWKHVLSAAFHKETALIAHGLDGGVVMLGARTSTMSKREFSEWLDFLNATAADRGIELETA